MRAIGILTSMALPGASPAAGSEEVNFSTSDPEEVKQTGQPLTYVRGSEGAGYGLIF